MLLRIRDGNPYTRILPVTGSLRDVHAERAEAWFGKTTYASLLRLNHYWPIPVWGGNAPLYAYRGSLLGPTRIGRFASFTDHCWDECKRRLRRAGRSHATLGTGFSSLGDLIAEATAGKQQVRHFTKLGTTGVSAVQQSLARVGNNPRGQTTAAAFAAGESPTNTTPADLGLGQDNPGGADTLHLLSGVVSQSVAGQGMLFLIDRFYQGNWNLATDPQSVSGTPSRYQDATSKGNFISAEVSTALGAGTPTIEVTYIDQDGNTAEATSSLLTVAGSAIVNRFPHATPDWAYRLNSGDTGVRSITNLNLSAASTGNLNVFLAKPLALIPLNAAAFVASVFDGLNTTFNLQTVATNACLVLLNAMPSVSNATNFMGMFVFVSG